MFDGEQEYKITKPIRLIELFAGIGSQAKALENLGANFEHYRICEFDKYAVKSYNAIHGTNFETSDITKISADDLGIVDTDKYEYIMTYSFPCTDLSLAGKQQGMSKGSGTRSGLLWEVERLLRECKQLPQILLMENVPQVIGSKNISDFNLWIEFLESLGYKNYYKILNAKDYGIPQNRNRCFMVSLLGDYRYNFPSGVELKLRLKDMLDDKVDEKYYLSDKGIAYITNDKRKNKYTQILTKEDEIAKSAITAVGNTNWTGNFIKEPILIGGIGEINFGSQYRQGNRIYDSNGVAICLLANPIGNAGGNSYLYKVEEPKCQQIGILQGGKWDKVHDSARRVYSAKGISPTITTCGGGNREPKILAYDEQNQYFRKDGTVGTLTTDGSSPKHNNRIVDFEKDVIRKLTPKECYRLMGFTDTDYERASQVNSNAQLYKQAGNSIVVNVLMAIFKNLL